MEQAKTTIHSYNQLKADWLTTPRGLGGVTAIKGFDYQFLFTIKRIVESFSSNVLVAAEKLSDISEFDTKSITITQSKYCLSSRAVNEALDELWDIYCFISTKYPNLQSCTSFIILGQCQELKNPITTINNWKSKKQWIESLEDFSKKVSTDICSNPYEEIIQILIEDYLVDDPWGTVSIWLGNLYRLLPQGDVAGACHKILSDLTVFRKNQKKIHQRKLFHLWKESDSPPDNVEKSKDTKTSYIVGETPKKYHLVQGLFAKRKVYSEIYESYQSWCEKVQSQPSIKLPVFWISGRSGSGKSVALLHLLSMVKSGSRETVVASFGDKPTSLDWFYPYLEDVCENHKNCVLSFDDPYIYERQEKFNNNVESLSSLAERLAERGYEQNIPYIVCCGPDEQVEWCEESLGDYITIEKFRLRNETKEDIEEVRSWFEIRTGLALDKSHDDSDKLLVQSMFEWSRSEPLKDFARSFKKRLDDRRWDNRGVSLFELISNVLAVNRLYALFPSNWIESLKNNDPYLAKAIHQLEKEDNHIALLSDDDGLKLTHPHLADVLYREWYGAASDTEFRKQHLSKWISFVADSSEKPKYSLMPLWIIAKLSNPSLTHEDQALPRIALIRDDLKSIFPAIYKKHLLFGNPLSNLPVWTNIDKNLQLELSPSPLDVLGESLVIESVNDEGFRLSCHKIIEFHSFSNELTKKNLHQVITLGSEWHEWGYIVLDYVKRLGVESIEREVINHVRNEPEAVSAVRIISYLASSAVETNEHSQRIIEHWLISCDMNCPSWVANYTDFSKNYPLNSELISKAKLFLNFRMDNKSWSHVWESCWEKESSDTDLEELARKWLALKFGQDQGWSFVWEKLTDTISGDLSLVNLGFQYLENDNPPKSMKCVWESLIRQSDNRIKLNQFAHNWLINTPIWHREWIYFWTPFIINYDANNRIFELARDWLCYVPVDHTSWIDTRDRVLNSIGLNRELTDKSILWLQESSFNDDSWPYIWVSIFAYGADEDFIVNLGIKWLREVDVNHKGWNMVWEKLWDKNFLTEELKSIGMEWMPSVNCNHYCWHYIWKRLFSDSPDDISLVNYAKNWLAAVDPSHRSWGHVWGALWNLAENQGGLRKSAVEWLKVAPKNHKSRHFVKSKLSQPVSINDKLDALKEKWGGK